VTFQVLVNVAIDICNELGPHEGHDGDSTTVSKGDMVNMVDSDGDELPTLEDCLDSDDD
jgi:hypothetical protein